jgi:hypothetical protein
MLQLWLAYMSDRSGQELTDDAVRGGRAPARAFNNARAVGMLNDRAVYWMLLIDTNASEHGELVASYGERPPMCLTGGPSFRITKDTKRWPAVGPSIVPAADFPPR